MKFQIEQINKILAQARLNGKNIKKRELALLMFPGARNAHSAVVCLANLEKGKSTYLNKIRKQRAAISKVTGIKEADILI